MIDKNRRNKGPNLRPIGEVAKEWLAEFNGPRKTEWRFEGEESGVWKLTADKEALECTLDRTGGVVYDIELETCRTCAGLVEVIFQIHHKSWVSEANMCALLAALQYLLDPQGIAQRKN